MIKKLVFSGIMLCMISVAASPAVGLGKFVGKSHVGFALRDPIVNHHQPTAGHNHMFLGNTKLLTLPAPESATFSDLVGKGQTNLNNPDDTAAYWVPDLVYTSGPNSGKSVPFHKFFAYYRSFDGKRFGAATPYPDDMRVVSSSGNWMCGVGDTPDSNIEAARCDLEGSRAYLTLHIDFPTCWNGELTDKNSVGDTSDNINLRFQSRGVCPAGFDIKLPELRMTVKWDYRGNGQDVALSSDIIQRNAGIPTKAGETKHADFWNTWVRTGGVNGGLVNMVTRCINNSSSPGWCN